MKSVRVRFAPSPTGLMHLGNVRVALFNFLFARQKQGTFIVRIEDTDPERNMDPRAQKIIEDLHWLGLMYEEGPEIGGSYGPYFQSERAHLYQEKLQELLEKGLVYRCFCTVEELERKRQRQLALKKPPRYDRACAQLSPSAIDEKLAAKIPFIWRFSLNNYTTLSIDDIAHKTITFDFNNFSDFALTRQDGSFTFMFANFVDDLLMQITHVIRGEDHLSNTAGQAALYQAFETPLPTFWHLPILCNAEGKKFSKRDFGFSLNDLRSAGFVPEALCNYLGITGGGTFEQEILSLDELAQAITIDNTHATGPVRYNIEKLSWMNHKWIDRYNKQALTTRARPFLEKVFPEARHVTDEHLTMLLQHIKSDITTLNDVPTILSFCFQAPAITINDITAFIEAAQTKAISSLIKNHLSLIARPTEFADTLKKNASAEKIPLKYLFWFVRLCLAGKCQGPGITELIEMLGAQESKERLEKVITSTT